MQRPRPQDGGRHGSPEASSCSPARPRLLDGGRHGCPKASTCPPARPESSPPQDGSRHGDIQLIMDYYA